MINNIDREWFRLRCEIIGISQNELARRIGMQPSSLSGILNGRRELKAVEAVQLATLLRARVSEVIRRLTGVEIMEEPDYLVPMDYCLGPSGELAPLPGDLLANARPHLPDRAICIQCRTLASSDQVLKSLDGWRLFCAPFAPAPSCVGRFVVAQLSAEAVALGMLMPGYVTGQFQILGPLPGAGPVIAAAVVLNIATR